MLLLLLIPVTVEEVHAKPRSVILLIGVLRNVFVLQLNALSSGCIVIIGVHIAKLDSHVKAVIGDDLYFSVLEHGVVWNHSILGVLLNNTAID